jgi:hypothetical protein
LVAIAVDDTAPALGRRTKRNPLNIRLDKILTRA